MDYVPAAIPAEGRVSAIALSLITTSVIVACFCWRLAGRQTWSTIPLAKWLIYAIYIDSLLFVFTTAIISQGLGLNNTKPLCSVAITLCLLFYMTTKVMIYLFLVERARLVRGTSRKPRTQDRLYLFNFFGMLIPYLVVIVLNFLYRFAFINQNGMCVIGMKMAAMVPLIAFDAIVNIYLTILFLVPLWSLYSFRNKLNTALRKTALRAFVGSCVTLSTSVANLLILMLLKGEPGYICLMCCNADILFSVVVLHWMTAGDGDPQQRSSLPEDPSVRPNHSPRIPMPPANRSATTDMSFTSDFPESNTVVSTRSRPRGVVSMVASDEYGQHPMSPDIHKDEMSVEEWSKASDEESRGGIMRRTSFTIESTKAESLLGEKAKT